MPTIIEDPQTKLLIEWIPDESEVVPDDHFADTCRRIAECGITVVEFEQAFIDIDTASRFAGDAVMSINEVREKQGLSELNPVSVVIRPFPEPKRR